MNSIETELILGFTDTVTEQAISTVKGDTERYVHCTLVEELLSYVVSEDVDYVILKGVYSNGEIITPMILDPVYSDDRTEMTFKIDPSFTQIPGIANCVIMFIKCNDIPEFDSEGNVTTFDANILTSDNFKLYIKSDVLEDGCLSPVDSVATSSLLQLIISAQEVIQNLYGIDETEAERVANELERIAAETERKTAELERADSEAQRLELQAALEALKAQIEELISDDYWAQISKSYAVGNSTSGREGEDEDNAKYYAEQAANVLSGNVIGAFSIENGDLYYTKTMFDDNSEDHFDFAIIDDEDLEVTIHG